MRRRDNSRIHLVYYEESQRILIDTDTKVHARNTIRRNVKRTKQIDYSFNNKDHFVRFLHFAKVQAQ